MTKITRELLWREHERIQKTYKQWEEFYKTNTEVIEELDNKRQDIVKKYYQFKDGEIKVNAQGQFVPKYGANLKQFDKEMEALMLGEETVEGKLPDSLAEILKVTEPLNKMNIVR